MFDTDHVPVCHDRVDVVAFDSLGTIGTAGVFGPALVLVGLVVYAVIRDRRVSERDDDEAPTPPFRAD